MSKLPKFWRHAVVIALPKPNKSAEDPKAYRPISLLCFSFKILERMIYSCIEAVVDTQQLQEQASLCQGRSAGDQITLLTQNIEDDFQVKEKVGVVLLDLTAAYDTVWHHGLHLKLLWTVPDCSLWKCYQTAALSFKSWKAIEDGQDQDMDILASYLLR